MALIRNSSRHPVMLASYQVDMTKFGKDGGEIYPGECRYVKAENFDWDKCVICAFTRHAKVPGSVSIDPSINIPNCPIGFTIHHNDSQAMAIVVVGKHSFFELKSTSDGAAVFVENESLGDSDCRVKHGW